VPRDTSSNQEKQPPFDERIKEAVTSLEGLGAETTIYDRDALLGAHSIVTNIAHEGFTTKEIDQPTSIEAKLEATRLAIQVAEAHGDKVTALSLDHLAQTLESLLTVIKPAETKPKQAATPKTKTSAAKS
jgi:hypothetical protein